MLFKQNLSTFNLDSSLKLELKNCIHQLAIENKLENIEVCDIIIKLHHQIRHYQLHHSNIIKLIENLQDAAIYCQEQISITNLSTLMNILLRIDYLEKFNKLDKQKIKLFNQRIYHL